jgi:hypothetical protein
MRWTGYVARTVLIRNVDKLLIGIPEGNVAFGDQGVNRTVMLKWILKKIGCECMDWIQLAQYRLQWQALVNTVLNFQVASKVASILSVERDCSMGRVSLLQ